MNINGHFRNQKNGGTFVPFFRPYLVGIFPEKSPPRNRHETDATSKKSLPDFWPLIIYPLVNVYTTLGKINMWKTWVFHGVKQLFLWPFSIAKCFSHQRYYIFSMRLFAWPWGRDSTRHFSPTWGIKHHTLLGISPRNILKWSRPAKMENKERWNTKQHLRSVMISAIPRSLKLDIIQAARHNNGPGLSVS